MGKEDSMRRGKDNRGIPCLSAAVPLKSTEIIYVHAGAIIEKTENAWKHLCPMYIFVVFQMYFNGIAVASRLEKCAYY